MPVQEPPDQQVVTLFQYVQHLSHRLHVSEESNAALNDRVQVMESQVARLSSYSLEQQQVIQSQQLQLESNRDQIMELVRAALGGNPGLNAAD